MMHDTRLRDPRVPLQERQAAADTQIMQKVNAANREAFLLKFPGHIEHTMRLISERLMHCLAKPATCDLDQPYTWPATTEQIRDLAQALVAVESLHQRWRQS